MTQPPLLSPLLPLPTIAAGLSGHPAFSGTPAGAWRRWDRALHLACLEGWEILPSQIPHAARDGRHGPRDLRPGLLWRHPTAGYVRCDEGGGLADVDDRPVAAPADGLLRLAHPHDTPLEVWVAWSAGVWADYKILPLWWQAPQKIVEGDILTALTNMRIGAGDEFLKIAVILRRTDPPPPATWPPHLPFLPSDDPKVIRYQLVPHDLDAALAAVPGADICADLACIGFARDYRSRRERAQLEADREPSPEPQF